MKTALEPYGGKNKGWKGGKCKLKSGYVWIKAPNHPNAYSSGQLYEHTFVMALHLGRPLRKGECVHHRNGNRSDNRIENLELISINESHIGRRVGSKREMVAFCVEYLRKHAPELLR